MKIRLPTPAWTRPALLVAVTGLIGLVGTAAAFSENATQGLLIVLALGVTLVLGLGWDAWVGLVIGLAMSAVVIIARQVVGTWVPSGFGAAAIYTAALVGTGWSAGLAGSHLRVSRSMEAGATDELEGAFGSLGMLPPDLALLRLDEEGARAVSYRRPLSLLVFDVTVIDPALEVDSRDDVIRAAARATETILRDVDVPFQISAERMGAILPETDATAAAVATGRILEAISRTPYIDRAQGRRRSLADAIALELAVVSLGSRFPGPDEMLQGALAALDQDVNG
ncbi:MAG: GGDEF domain-containing protein [Chloroflexi bacterium]|nr:GGDEF domain-containing protein [Chloroflexota bacterium]